MISLPLRAVIAAVRAWTWLYTSGLPLGLRERRREEIESDLWESIADGRDRRILALLIASRLIAGIPDDLGWRAEHGPPNTARRWRLALTALAILGLWLAGQRNSSTRLPELPASVQFPTHPKLTDAPLPPPPPPPPCLPKGFPQQPGCTR